MYLDIKDSQMGILKFSCFLLCLFFFFHVISATSCSISRCGSQTIRFPFNCGYSGFTLTCKTPQNNTFLTLPGSGDFLVQEINYLTRTILVSDEAKCLPERLQRLNLSHTPFMANLSTSSYTLYSCPPQFQRLGFPTVSCLSNTTTSVLALLNPPAMLSRRCREIHTLMLPSGNFTAFFMGDVGLYLKWRLPLCQDSEANGGSRGLDDHNQIVCKDLHPYQGESKEGIQVLKIIALSIGIPATICAIGIAAFLCILDRGVVSQEAAVNPQPPPPAAAAAGHCGLEQATIDLYTKVVVGESKRVPWPNDDTCHICLSEFKANDTLRCIPDCHHCFHADCVDEWLRLKASCPLCRKLPFTIKLN